MMWRKSNQLDGNPCSSTIAGPSPVPERTNTLPAGVGSQRPLAPRGHTGRHHPVIIKRMNVDFTPDPKLYPFTSQWFDGRHGRMHYVDVGSGPPILLYHGNPTWSFLYRDIIARLQERFRCIAMDYLGFGLSERPRSFGYTIEEHASAVGALVDHLDLDGYLTVGQDWGGPISMAVNTTRADRVRGLVLGNTWFWPADTLATKTFSRVMSSRPMQYAILHRNFFVERLIPLGAARALSTEVMAHYRGVQPTPSAGRRRADADGDPGRRTATAPPGRRCSGDTRRQAGALGLGNEGFRLPAEVGAAADARDIPRPCRSSNCPTPSTSSRRTNPTGSPMRSSRASGELPAVACGFGQVTKSRVNLRFPSRWRSS